MDIRITARLNGLKSSMESVFLSKMPSVTVIVDECLSAVVYSTRQMKVGCFAMHASDMM